MATTASFDVTTGVDLQEVDNAINQTQKEIAQRYDFKGSKAEVDFKRAENKILLVADSDFQMTALFDVLQAKFIKRGVPVKNLDIGEIKPAGGDTVRREVGLKMSLDGDTAKKVAAAIKEAKLKKVQAANLVCRRRRTEVQQNGRGPSPAPRPVPSLVTRHPLP
ncbi:MAG TPA: DUF520 family protein, partial [Rubellimicrobium sp.]|nr:DUF520 family protein [Rubellimicrobium sp.]